MTIRSNGHASKWWYWNDVPAPFDRYICCCEKPDYDTRFSELRCGKCNKLFYTFLRECERCKNLYLCDFKVPYVIEIEATTRTFYVQVIACWDCVGGEGEWFEPPRIRKRVDFSELEAEIGGFDIEEFV